MTTYFDNRNSFSRTVVLLFCWVAYTLLVPGALTAQGHYNDYWPNWRGPNADGVSPAGTPPTQWSETEHIRWKLPIPGSTLQTEAAIVQSSATVLNSESLQSINWTTISMHHQQLQERNYTSGD